jgi:hypothetical protein
MRVLKYFIFYILLLVFGNTNGQEVRKSYECCDTTINSKDEIIPNKFYEKILEDIIFDQINYYLGDRNFEIKKKDSLLIKVAKSQAVYMAENNTVTIIRNSKNNKTTADRLKALGGSGFGKELVTKNNIRSGKIPYTYSKVANDIVFRWFTSSKTIKLFETTQYNTIGIGVKLGKKKTKVYVSLILGNFKSFNNGIKYISNLPIPYSEKTYGLDVRDDKICKKVDKSQNIIDLQDGLSCEDNIIYFETNDLKSLKKLIDYKKDGLAVDILQKEQFNCNTPNIINYSNLNQGVLTKRIFSKKLFKNNIIDKDEYPNGFKTQLAILPDNISDNIELNLVVIKDKKVCKILPKSFLIYPKGIYNKDISLVADTVTINTKFIYKPKADSIELSMRIPFENNKYTYKSKDIEKFINLLNEPKFIIYKLKITAYSSIEGSEKENRILQKKRAESIEKALENRQTNVINTEIKTSFNWNDFKKDIKHTKYNKLENMNMTEAQEYIRKNNLNKELEYILKNHRYAQIDMSIFYDISGDNEQIYVLKKINDAIIDKDNIMALSIEKYIMKQILNDRYNVQILDKINIPNDYMFAGLNMNKFWLQYHKNKITLDELILKVDSLYLLSPENEYIAFNHCLLRVENIPLRSLNNASLLQSQIDKLYYTSLSKNIIDNINIKMQLKQLDYVDSIPNNKRIKKQYLDKLKQVINLNEETIENTLKLAEIFVENNDYPFAIDLLEYKITQPDVPKELLLSYVSLCSKYEDRMHTKRFNYAMGRIYNISPELFCKLFNGDYFSFKVLENNFIKQRYCKYCNGGK